MRFVFLVGTDIGTHACQRNQALARRPLGQQVLAALVKTKRSRRTITPSPRDTSCLN